MHRRLLRGRAGLRHLRHLHHQQHAPRAEQRAHFLDKRLKQTGFAALPVQAQVGVWQPLEPPIGRRTGPCKALGVVSGHGMRINNP